MAISHYRPPPSTPPPPPPPRQGKSWGNSGWEQAVQMGCVPSSRQTQQPNPWRCTLRRLKMRMHRILAPGSWGAYQRNDFNEPWLLHLSIHRKALNSLTWDVWFSLINSNLLMFRLPCLLLQKLLYILAPPLPLQSNLSELSEMLCPGLKSSVLSTK